jgi:hypothetical protein
LSWRGSYRSQKPSRPTEMSPEHMVACTLRTHLPLELNKSGATMYFSNLLEVQVAFTHVC